jgi:hypothetical protein
VRGGLTPRSRSLTVRGLRAAASASSSWVGRALVRSCHSNPAKESEGCSATTQRPSQHSAEAAQHQADAPGTRLRRSCPLRHLPATQAARTRQSQHHGRRRHGRHRRSRRSARTARARARPCPRKLALASSSDSGVAPRSAVITRTPRGRDFCGRSCGLSCVVIIHRADHSRSRYRPEPSLGGSRAESWQPGHL